MKRFHNVSHFQAVVQFAVAVRWIRARGRKADAQEAVGGIRRNLPVKVGRRALERSRPRPGTGSGPSSRTLGQYRAHDANASRPTATERQTRPKTHQPSRFAVAKNLP